MLILRELQFYTLCREFVTEQASPILRRIFLSPSHVAASDRSPTSLVSWTLHDSLDSVTVTEIDVMSAILKCKLSCGPDDCHNVLL